MALYPHNIPVYNNLKRTLEISGKAILVTFTGGGKSFIATEYLDEENIENALVVTPRNAVCAQWTKLTPRIKTMTYSVFVKTPIIALNRYPVVIFDEAHHLGSSVWGAKAKEFMNQVDYSRTKVIGLTADSRRWSDGKRDIADELFPNCRVNGYTLSEAITHGIIKPFTYVCTLHELNLTEKCKEYQTKAKGVRTQIIERLISELQYHMKNQANITSILHKHMPAKPKGVVFVSDIRATVDAQKMLAEAYPDVPQFVVHSNQPKTKTESELEKFIDSETGFIINISMLTEGLHAAGVNNVIMFRRTKSPNVFFQQIGRGIAAKHTENLVIFDVVGNHMSLKTISANIGKPLGLFVNIKSEKPEQICFEDYISDTLTLLQNIEAVLNDTCKWTSEEDNIIQEFYPKEGSHVAARLPGRTAFACNTRAIHLNVKFDKNVWTPKEDNILQQYYLEEGLAVTDRLPGRTKYACQQRAKRLGLVKSMAQWTPTEDDILRQYYPTEKANITKRLPMRTLKACLARATRLGISTEWTTKEDDIIKQYFPIEGTNIINRLPHRTRKACQARAIRLNVHIASNRWTKTEDDIITQYYPMEGIVGVSKRLPNRTDIAIRTRAGQLKIATEKASKRWTNEELAILIKYYPTDGIEIIKKLPNRSLASCQLKANKLGLRVTK